MALSDVSGKVMGSEVGVLRGEAVGASVEWDGVEERWVNIERGIGVGGLPVLADGFRGALSTGVNGEITWLEGAGDEGTTHDGPCPPR